MSRPQLFPVISFLLTTLVVLGSGCGKNNVAKAPVLTAPVPVVPSAPPPPVPAPPAPSLPPELPQDVLAYLRWLSHFEAARKTMEQRQTLERQNPTTRAWTGAGASADGALTLITRHIDEYNRTAAAFRRQAAPPSCQSLAAYYAHALDQSATALSRTVTRFTTALASMDRNNPQTTEAIFEQLKIEQRSGPDAQQVSLSFAGANDALNTLRSQYTHLPSDIANFFLGPGESGS